MLLSPINRKGAALGIAILVVPPIFVWVLLRRGYSTLARVIGFCWLGFIVLITYFTPGPEDVPEKALAERPEQTVVPEPLTEKQQNQKYIAQLSEAEIVSSCDRAVIAAMKSRGSFDTAWGWDYLKYPDAGQVAVLREFEAQNSFGGTMSSQYRCLVDAKTKSLVQLAIKQGGGWDVIYNQ